jgi:hypothetical protein
VRTGPTVNEDSRDFTKEHSNRTQENKPRVSAEATSTQARVAHNAKLRRAPGQRTNEQTPVQGLGTQGDTVPESINHHAF